MKKIAIVVQRCHEKVVGGSEAEAWHYANLLKDCYEVHILTTTALDFESWENVLPERDELNGGINIRRFKVTQKRSEYWGEFHRLLLDDHNKKDFAKKPSDRLVKWPTALQEEFIYKQGPYSEGLLEFLSEKGAGYKAVIFLTYLYATTYFGMFNVAEEKIVFVPTLHDEPTAYLSVYKYMAKRAKKILFNTQSEYEFAKLLWGDLPGYVVGMAVNTIKFSPSKLDFPYILYCGRVDVNKGFPQLIDYFLKYKKNFPSGLRLVLTGDNKIDIPASEDILFKGNVPEREKFELMSGAGFFTMPSPNESFSIVTLEAMAQETPVLASDGSKVIVDHIRKSNAGFLYNDYESFEKGVNILSGNAEEARDIGKRGRRYVVNNYSIKIISKKLKEIIENLEQY